MKDICRVALLLAMLSACGGSVAASTSDAAASDGSRTTVSVVASSCTSASPCVAGSNGCPENAPSGGADWACSPVGAACYGYGTLSCPKTLTCDSGVWQTSTHCLDWLDAEADATLDAGDNVLDGGADSLGETAFDAAIGFNGQPCSQYKVCVLDGDAWTCDCGFGGPFPNCPASATPGASCEPEDSGSCMGCDGLGTSLGGGLMCGCDDFSPYGADAGPQWECMGTEQACQWTR